MELAIDEKLISASGDGLASLIRRTFLLPDIIRLSGGDGDELIGDDVESGAGNAAEEEEAEEY